MIRLAAALMLCATPVLAETVFAARTIPARTIIGAEDVMIRDLAVPGAVTDPGLVVGQEARVALYAGRPVRAGDIGPPAVIERNQIVPLVYRTALMTIATEGRAMDRAGPGDVIRVMNLASRNTVTARIAADGTAYVSQ